MQNNETFYKRKGSECRESSKKNTSDSLDKLLFEDTKRNIYELSLSDSEKR